MKRDNLFKFGLTALTGVTTVLASLPALAQQINGVPGSPSATQVINGNQIPPPPLPFGGVIPTPAMDRVAQAGLRYTQFHSTALCSPTRAARNGAPVFV